MPGLQAEVSMWQPCHMEPNFSGCKGAHVNSNGTVSLVVQTVENLPAMLESWARSLGWGDPLEKGMATHSSIPAWRIEWTAEPGRLQYMGFQGVRQN